MKVIRAKAMGMCFGVREALTVMRALPNPQEVTVYGELVHNPEICLLYTSPSPRDS